MSSVALLLPLAFRHHESSRDADEGVERVGQEKQQREDLQRA